MTCDGEKVKKWYNNGVVVFSAGAEVTYIVDGVSHVEEVEDGQSCLSPTSFATPTKSNYTFLGWNTDQKATTALTECTMNGEPITLYAIWMANTISVPITFSPSSFSFYYDEESKGSNAINLYSTSFTKGAYRYLTIKGTMKIREHEVAGNAYITVSVGTSKGASNVLSKKYIATTSPFTNSTSSVAVSLKFDLGTNVAANTPLYITIYGYASFNGSWGNSIASASGLSATLSIN